MNDKPKSERRPVAERIAAFILDNDLANPFGGDVALKQSGKRKFYSVSFSRPAVLDGQIEVYSPKFILVQAQGRLAQAGDQRVFESEENALRYLRLAFVEFKFDEALLVPTKPPKASR